MKQRGLVVLWWAVCVAVVVIVWVDAFGASLEPTWAWMAANDNAASWIQAFGSIAAIFGSAAIAMFMFRKETESRRNEAKAEKLASERAAVIEFQTGVMILRAALMMCQKHTGKSSWTPNNVRLVEGSLATASQLLTGVDGRQLPEWFELQRALVVIGAVGASSGVLKIEGELPKQPSKSFDAFRATLEMVDEIDGKISAYLFN